MSEFEFSEGVLHLDVWTETVFVPPELRYLDGHFPGAPIVPGVAQLVALAEERTRVAWPSLGVCSGVRRLKFTDALRPGHRLHLRLHQQPTADRGVKVGFRITRGDTPCSRGTLLFPSP